MIENIKYIFKRLLYGKIKNVGMRNGIGFIPHDDYYIDEHTYLFGFRLKSVRYWNHEDYVAKRDPRKKERNVVRGFMAENISFKVEEDILKK